MISRKEITRSAFVFVLQSILVCALSLFAGSAAFTNADDAPAPQTLFNVSPISISTDGLTEDEATFARALEESVNVVCNASTLREIRDAWTVGRGRHYLDPFEMRWLRENNRDQLMREVEEENISSNNEYLEAFLNKDSGALFGNINNTCGVRSAFEGVVVKKQKTFGDVMLLLNDNGYVELSLDAETSPKRIRRIALTYYENREGILYEFHPNGTCKSRVSFRYSEPHDACILNSEPSSLKIPENDDNPIVNFILRRSTICREEPREVFGEEITWDQTGTFVERKIIDNQSYASRINDGASTADANENDKKERLVEPNFLGARVAIPDEGFYDEYDKSVAQEIAQTVKLFATSNNTKEWQTRLNALSKSIYGTDENGDAFEFDSIVWTASGFKENYVKFICKKGCVSFRMNDQTNRQINEWQPQKSFEGNLNEAKVTYFGQNDALFFFFYDKNALGHYLWGKFSRPQLFEIASHTNCMATSDFLKSYSKPENVDYLADAMCSSIFPARKTKIETHWNSDGSIKNRTLFTETVPWMDNFFKGVKDSE